MNGASETVERRRMSPGTRPDPQRGIEHTPWATQSLANSTQDKKGRRSSGVLFSRKESSMGNLIQFAIERARPSVPWLFNRRGIAERKRPARGANPNAGLAQSADVTLASWVADQFSRVRHHSLTTMTKKRSNA